MFSSQALCINQRLFNFLLFFSMAAATEPLMLDELATLETLLGFIATPATVTLATAKMYSSTCPLYFVLFMYFFSFLSFPFLLLDIIMLYFAHIIKFQS